MAVTIHGSYGALLWDRIWREKRERIINRDNGRCIFCGSTEDLIVHHKRYHVTEEGKKYVPWAYDDKYLITVCKKCHQAGHNKYEVPIIIIKNK